MQAKSRRRRSTLALLIGMGLVSGCHSLPSLEGRTESSALTEEIAATTRLGQAIQPRLAEHPDASGIHSLDNPREAFAARALLASAAQRTLDAQYYIWRNDMTGTLMLEALHEAADRGVRVRLLVDDNGINGLDGTLTALDAHPNIEVRLFNPFTVRSPKWLGYLTDFSRANRRMHNKSFTADNQAAIVGGRNIGDEYFGATDGVLFADLDVITIGPVVRQVSHDFDRYWASQSSYPVSSVIPPNAPQALEKLATQASIIESDPAAQAYVQALRDTGLVRRLLDGDLPLDWANTQMISDDPAKGLGKAPDEALLIERLKEIIGASAHSFDLVSPYFVPTKAGTEALTALAEQGVRIRILTNSLAATDVTAVHAGYAKRRKDLLKAGIQLYEMRRTSPAKGAKRSNERAGPFGSSGASLHAKTFSIDEQRVFVGSFNFDPRSANLNTELGFIIDSPVMAHAVKKAFDQEIPERAYQVRLSEKGNLYWQAEEDGDLYRYDREPDTSWWRRLLVRGYSWLPIEWLL